MGVSLIKAFTGSVTVCYLKNIFADQGMHNGFTPHTTPCSGSLEYIEIYNGTENSVESFHNSFLVALRSTTRKLHKKSDPEENQEMNILMAESLWWSATLLFYDRCKFFITANENLATSLLEWCVHHNKRTMMLENIECRQSTALHDCGGRSHANPCCRSFIPPSKADIFIAQALIYWKPVSSIFRLA